MDLSVREAATLVGCHPRTLRARIARGEIEATKRGGRWYVPRGALPLTESQRRVLTRRIETVQDAVDAALPSRLARSRAKGSRSVLDLDAFRMGRELLTAMRANDCGAAQAAGRLEEALLTLAEASHTFDKRSKLALLRSARGELSRCAGHLLLADAELASPQLEWVLRLEHDILPSMAGLLRWAERLKDAA